MVIRFCSSKGGKRHNSPSTFPRWVPPSDRSIIRGDWCQNDRLFVDIQRRAMGSDKPFKCR